MAVKAVKELHLGPPSRKCRQKHCTLESNIGEHYICYKGITWLLLTYISITSLASVFEEVKEWDECLLMLGDNEVDEDSNVLMIDDQDTELLDKDVEEWEINIGAAICLLQGRAFEALENRARALRWYKAALKADPYCYEAFEHLIDHHMLRSEEEVILLNSLKFDPEDRWLSLLYSCRAKKYGQVSVIEEKFQELEREPDESRPEEDRVGCSLKDNNDVIACRADYLYH